MRVRTRTATAAVATILLAGAAALTITPATASASAPSHRARTVQLVRRLLSDVVLPPGARRHSSAPVRALRHPASTEQSSNLVHRRAWFVVDGSVSHVLSYAKHHGVPGCRFDESGVSYGPGRSPVRDVGCSGRGTGYAAYVQLDVEAVATGHGTAVRADAEAVWIPARPAYSRVVDPSRVHIVVQRHPRHPTVRRTLGPAKATQLARVLNRLTVEPPVAVSCPADRAGIEDRLRFDTPAGRVTATAHLSGCPAVDVDVAHHPATQLTLTAALDRTVRHLLHLPRSYS